MQRQYKIRKFENGRNNSGEPFINYSMTIPSDIAGKLPADLLFSVELTEDGILFKPSGRTSYDQPLPEWAEDGTERMKDAPISRKQGQHAKRARPRRRPTNREAA